jgi:hypothetical protein
LSVEILPKAEICSKIDRMTADKKSEVINLIQSADWQKVYLFDVVRAYLKLKRWPEYTGYVHTRRFLMNFVERREA